MYRYITCISLSLYKYIYIYIYISYYICLWAPHEALGLALVGRELGREVLHLGDSKNGDHTNPPHPPQIRFKSI